jgi:hypothetical protein
MYRTEKEIMKRIFTALLSLFLVLTTAGCSAAWDKLDGTYRGDFGSVLVGGKPMTGANDFTDRSLKISGKNVAFRDAYSGEENKGVLEECKYSDDKNEYACEIKFETEPQPLSGTQSGSYTLTAYKNEGKPASYILNVILIGNFGSSYAAGMVVEMKKQ